MQKHFLLTALLCTSLTRPILCMEDEKNQSPLSMSSESKKKKNITKQKKSSSNDQLSSFSFAQPAEQYWPSPFALVKIPRDIILKFFVGDKEISKNATYEFENLVSFPAREKKPDFSFLSFNSTKYSVQLDNLATALIKANPDFFIKELSKTQRSEITQEELSAEPVNFFTRLMKKKEQFTQSTTQAINEDNSQEVLIRIYDRCKVHQDDPKFYLNGGDFPDFRNNANANAKKLEEHIESQQNSFKRNYKKVFAGFGLLCGAIGVAARPYVEKLAKKVIAGSMTLLQQGAWYAAQFIKDQTGK